MQRIGGIDESELEAVGITRIERGDEALFNSFFDRRRQFAYANSWTYVTQAANGHALSLNGLGYKFHNDLGIVAVGCFLRPIDGKLCFHVINPIGTKRVELCGQVCGRLASLARDPVYVKKVDRQLRAQLLNEGSYCAGLLEPWHVTALREDDTFPEVIIKLREISTLLSGSGSNDLKDKMRRFTKRHRGSKIEWRSLMRARKDAWAIVNEFFSGYAQEDISSATDYSNMIGDERCDDRLIKEVVYIDGRPVAIFVAEGIGRTSCVGLYCNLCLYKEYRYLSEYVLATGLLRLRAGGFRYANLGGSETANLDRFKRKFARNPRNNDSHWMLYCP